MHTRLCTGSRLGAGLLVALSWAAVAQGPVPDGKLQADAQKQLRGKQFSDVTIQASGGVVTLTGQVKLLADKLEAQKKIDGTHEAASVDNQITIHLPEGISDAELYSKLGKKLAYDGQGYGTVAFNYITLEVRNGVAILGGEVVLPVDKESALGIVTHQPGVRGLVDHLQVAPLSPNDDGIRRAVFAAVYGAPQLNRYALNPVKPIRIIVINGHVTLAGAVDNVGDRDVAGIRANGVPGVFSVKNDLQIAGQRPER